MEGSALARPYSCDRVWFVRFFDFFFFFFFFREDLLRWRRVRRLLLLVLSSELAVDTELSSDDSLDDSLEDTLDELSEGSLQEGSSFVWAPLFADPRVVGVRR